MIIDARRLDADQRIRCDTCIVGAGPAGIVMALELARSGKDIVLLESGGTKFEAGTNDLNKGTVTDPNVHGPLEDYRRRELGGATTAWGGRCVPFDPIDYEHRPFVPNSGWPFGSDKIDPFCVRAHAYLDLGAYKYDSCDALPEPNRNREMIPRFASEDLTTVPMYLFSPPTNFRARYRDELAASRRIRVFLYANCLEIVTNREGTRVDRVDAGAMNGARFSISARNFVLAAGGLEVTRLMLASNRFSPTGLGNQYDLLGRYYMCHLTHHLEFEFSAADLVWDYEKTRDGVYCQRTISVTAEKQRKLGLLNHRARIEHPPIGDPTHRNGVLSSAFLAKWLMRTELATKYVSPRLGTLSRGVVNVDTPEQRALARRRLKAHLRNVLTDMPNVLGFSKRWINERLLSPRKLPSMVLRNEANIYTLRIDAEQVPNPESRVTLGDDADTFGQRRLHVDWRYTENDRQNLARTAEVIGQALCRGRAGTVFSVPAVDPKATGGHHIGTTRMAASPLRGLVDADCRVHGIGNLFIASSSVFPTSSYANPTLMVLALGIRLADYLSNQRPYGIHSDQDAPPTSAVPKSG